MEGRDLKGSRDDLQERILTDTKWCLYCCYAGCGVDGLDLPCCFCLGEVCCLGGTVKLTNCWDQDGCCSTTSKCFCCLSGFEFPIDNTPGVGCGPLRCLSNLEGRTPEDCKSAAAKDELDTYQKTLWCAACYFCFQGCTYDLSPVCEQQGKLCCCWTQVGSASCCDDGWIECDAKCCGCVFDASCPAGFTPGCVCCGTTCCCAAMPESPENEATRTNSEA